jgi:cytochrome c5
MPSTSLLPVIFLFLCIPAVDGQPRAPGTTVLDGVYTDAQAARGSVSYKAVCSACHGGALEGVSAPTLTGDHFLERWREDTLDSFYNFIKGNMPPRRAGDVRIPDSSYLDIVTYVLKMNGYRSGATNLSVDFLGKVMVVGKSGPRPVPDDALVLTVGCLSQAPGGTWILYQATEPVRTRSETTSTPEELKASAQKSPGTLSFRLADLEAVPEFKPGAQKGHKMQAKGYLVRQPNAERIRLSSMELIDTKCGR